MRLTHKELKELNKVVMLVAIVEPLTTLPQIIDVWTKPDTSGVSFLTWGLYVLFEFIWVVYGLAIKNKQVIVSNVMWILMDGAVAVGALLR